MIFFFFILVRGDQTEPHAASQETPWSWWERELSDYCFGQWLASVWGRGGKKRERVSERARHWRGGGQEGGKEGTRAGGGCCCRLKEQKGGEKKEKKEKKLLGALFTGRTLGLEETRGSRASHQFPHMSFTHSFKQYRAPPDCIRGETMKWPTSPAGAACPWSAGAVLVHPEGPLFTPKPPIPRSLALSMFLLCFFPPQAIFFFPQPPLCWALASPRSPLDLYLSPRDLERGKQGSSGH